MNNVILYINISDKSYYFMERIKELFAFVEFFDIFWDYRTLSGRH